MKMLMFIPNYIVTNFIASYYCNCLSKFYMHALYISCFVCIIIDAANSVKQDNFGDVT